MFLEDYHLHSKYSFDSQMDVEKIINESEKKKISEIAITDHVELAADFWGTSFFVGNESSAEIAKLKEKYQKKIEIRRGIELGNANIELKKSLEISRMFDGDLILGSVHNLVKDRDVGFYNYQKMDLEDFFTAYLKAVCEIAHHADFDILAHITYPLKAIYEQTGWVLNPDRFRDQFEKIFEVLIRREKGIEINTSGLRVSLGKLLPDQEILGIYKECGGTIITIGSDAHKEADISEGIEEATACLISLGYTSVTTFENRIPKQQQLGAEN